MQSRQLEREVARLAGDLSRLREQKLELEALHDVADGRSRAASGALATAQKELLAAEEGKAALAAALERVTVTFGACPNYHDWPALYFMPSICLVYSTGWARHAS
jgi:hypothetical protein